jgi:hypothetical protein
MAFDIEFTDSRQQIAVDDIRMSDATTGRFDITAPGDKSPQFAWSKFIISQVVITGIPVSMVPPQILPKLKSGNLVGLKLRLTNGEVYTGEIGIDRYDTGSPRKGDPNLSATLTGTFTGEKIQDSQKAIASRTIGTKIDLHNGTTFTIGYQDSRMDSAVRPFYIDGVEDNEVAVNTAIRKVVDDLGGATHTHPADDSLYVLSASGGRYDGDSVTGTVMYGRGPRDCSPAAPSVTVSYEERRIRVTQSISGPDNSGCGNIAIVKTIKVKVPTLSVRIPCVWTDPPAQPMFTGGINDGSYSIFGMIFPTRTLRCDGFDFNPYDSPAGIYYVGTIRFFFNPMGWRAGSLTCIFPVQLPLEGNQTQPGYTLNSVFEEFFEYPQASFDELHEICPNCYFPESV